MNAEVLGNIIFRLETNLLSLQRRVDESSAVAALMAALKKDVEKLKAVKTLIDGEGPSAEALDVIRQDHQVCLEMKKLITRHGGDENWGYFAIQVDAALKAQQGCLGGHQREEFRSKGRSLLARPDVLWKGAPGPVCCHKCSKEQTGHPVIHQMMICPVCGNKRCPKASDHELACTGSNEPGQKGSIFE